MCVCVFSPSLSRRHDDLKEMLDSNKDSLKLEAMKRIVAVSVDSVCTGMQPTSGTGVKGHGKFWKRQSRVAPHVSFLMSHRELTELALSFDVAGPKFCQIHCTGDF